MKENEIKNFFMPQSERPEDIPAQTAKILGPFYRCDIYNDAGDMVTSTWLKNLSLFENSIGREDAPFREETEMAKFKRCFTINGAKRWVSANNEQEYAEKLLQLFQPTAPTEPQKHSFKEYATNWFEVYSKPNIETSTATTYKRQLERYLIPAFHGIAIEDVTSDDVQRLFNGMETAKATKEKVKMVLNQILEAAVEDNLLFRNPLRSSRVRISGKASKSTEPYSVEQMRFLVQHIEDIKIPQDRTYLSLQALHPLRLEEVLGLTWADIDIENLTLHVKRAVTHPTRNQPEVKTPKTESSTRVIGLSRIALKYLDPGNPEEYVIGGEKPLSYTSVRRMCERIQRETGFEEKVTPIRFRTTVLTDLYNQTKDIKLAQQAAGHTTSAMTLKYYVKGREDVSNAAAAIANAYTSEEEICQ